MVEIAGAAIAAELDEAGAEAAVARPGTDADGGEQVGRTGGEGGTWPDESAESAFLAEARQRGELPVAAQAEPAAEEADARALPALEEMVRRVPTEVREALDDLFRARFVRVTRVPAKALKR